MSLEQNFLSKIIAQYTTQSTSSSDRDEVKRQPVYLSLYDTDIVFDEDKHIYSLPRTGKTFAMSVTGFIKNHILHTDFDAVRIIRNTKLDADAADTCEFDVHAARLIEWKYASVFGSLFHAFVEFFFVHIVNDCPHEECHLQIYNKYAYKSWQIDETNKYNLSFGKCSQVNHAHHKFTDEPKLPCLYALYYYDEFVKIILDYDNFTTFLKNNHRYNIANEFYIKEITNIMERTFEGCNLKKHILNYRKSLDSYEAEIDKLLHNIYTTGKYLSDLEAHLRSFRSVLMHIPLHEYFDIRPEYIVFSEVHGIAGSVDLTMRMREDPYSIMVYDWKTCKSIFTNVWDNDEKSTRLEDYACQLHTYANLMKSKDCRFNFRLYVVNVTHTDSCIYNVKDHVFCRCKDIFESFEIPMLEE